VSDGSSRFTGQEEARQRDPLREEAQRLHQSPPQARLLPIPTFFPVTDTSHAQPAHRPGQPLPQGGTASPSMQPAQGWRRAGPGAQHQAGGRRAMSCALPLGRKPRVGEELRPRLTGGIFLLSFLAARAAPHLVAWHMAPGPTSTDFSCRRGRIGRCPTAAGAAASAHLPA
jgi:hypothetical protein